MSWVEPNWPAPKSVQAFSTTRFGGVSQGVYASANYGLHVNDQQDLVLANRQALVKKLAGSPIQWLNQVHGSAVFRAGPTILETEADAVITAKKRLACAVLTADCLPVLICDKNGLEVAAVHAGWRGLADGIVINTVNQFSSQGKDLMVWLGPAIGPDAFEVGVEVVAAMRALLPSHIGNDKFCKAMANGKYLLDLYAVARMQLASCGVTSVYGGEHCTYSNAQKFYSYRRDGYCGRMASVIQIVE